jgi:hypothetical protein
MEGSTQAKRLLASRPPVMVCSKHGRIRGNSYAQRLAASLLSCLVLSCLVFVCVCACVSLRCFLCCSLASLVLDKLMLSTSMCLSFLGASSSGHFWAPLIFASKLLFLTMRPFSSFLCLCDMFLLLCRFRHL